MCVGDIGIVPLPLRSEDSLITIGTILGAVGLKGEVRCLLQTDFPERFTRLSEVTIATKEGSAYPLRIKAVRSSPPFIFVLFEGVSSFEEAALLKGSWIQIPEEERVALPPDHYYQYEMIGLTVYLEDRTMLGKIESILSTGGNDVYLVRKEGREYLIPALKRVISKVDLAQREMIITPMEGLLDL